MNVRSNASPREPYALLPVGDLRGLAVLRINEHYSAEKIVLPSVPKLGVHGRVEVLEQIEDVSVLPSV